MARFQRLPSPPGKYAAAHVFKPRLQDLKAYGADANKVATAMQESLLAGFAQMLELPYAIPRPLREDALVGPMLSFNLGRCLWSWEDCAPDGVPEQMKAWALRPSSLLPIDLQEVSPRLVTDLIGSFAAVERLVSRACAEPLDRLDLRIGLADYGVPIPRLTRMAPQAAKESIFGHQYMTMDSLSESGMFADDIARSTLYRCNLGEKLIKLQSAVCQQAVDVLTSASAPEADAPFLGTAGYLHAELNKQYLGVVDGLMVRPWSMGLDSELAEYEYAPVIRRLLVSRLQTASVSVIAAPHLLQMAYLTGISPAAFVRHAIKDAKRRSITYIHSGVVSRLAGLVRAESRAPAAQALAGELDRLAKELAEALAVEDPLVRMLTKCRPEKAFPEWGLGTVARETRADKLARMIAEDTDDDVPL